MIVGKIISENGSAIVDTSTTNIIQQNQQNNMRSGQTTDQTTNNKDTGKSIRLVMDNTHRKVDFYRVIMALHQEGFFKSADGGDAAIKDVFHAFGTMLGEDFDEYAKNMFAGSLKKTEIKIFARLEQAFLTYEQEKEQKADSRR
jgi:hypothetical protein